MKKFLCSNVVYTLYKNNAFQINYCSKKYLINNSTKITRHSYFKFSKYEISPCSSIGTRGIRINSFFISTILRVFLDFKFLPRNEEKNGFPHEERGIFEEFPLFNLDHIPTIFHFHQCQFNGINQFGR